MKNILTIFILLSFSAAMAQSPEYNKIENQIKQAINKGIWDEVLLLSPDLTIEDPFRGDGYYYTALAFMKLGKPEKAETWIQKATALADDDLSAKLKTLSSDNQKAKQAVQIRSQADAQTNSGNSQKAAEEWIRLWNLDKTQVDYALNALEILIERKQFEEAYLLLEDPSIANDPSSRSLREQVAKTAPVSRLLSYRNALKDGNKSFGEGKFSRALSLSQDALTIRPGDKEATALKQQAEDEIAWAKASNTNSIGSYEEYLSGNTLRVHRGMAKNRLRGAMFKYGKEAADNGDIEQMESYLNRLKKSYYKDQQDIVEANKILVAAYSIKASKLEDSKSPRDLSAAIELLKKAMAIYPGTAYSLKIKELEKKKLRYGRPDRTYLAYVYDSVTNFGISIGGLKNRKIGVYITASANADFFTSGSSYTVDNSGKLDGSVLDDVRLTGEKRTGRFDGVFGLTKKIAYPVWVYAGGGVSITNHFWNMDEYYSNGVFAESSWVKNTDESSIKPMAEAGVIIDLSGFHLRGGVKTHDFSDLKNFNYSVGIGFSFK